MEFKVQATSGQARVGQLSLACGKVRTPAFMPVGTSGVVKTLSPAELNRLGAEIILANTYHLYLQPGLDVLEKFGGLHNFMRWERPILTDSGGFQVFSLAKLKRVDDDGVIFNSHLNGDTVHLTPERSAEIQQVIGSDIAMVLDECVALPNSRESLRRSVERSLHWAKRFLKVPRKADQSIFGIVQGGTERDLRLESLGRTIELPIDGVAIGGLSVGESFDAMVQTLEDLAPALPAQMPHYLMGVGTPRDLLEGIRLGIDLFDCVLPTRVARNAGFFTDDGLINIRNSCHRQSDFPIQDRCTCECCQTYSRGYLRHLFQIKEILGCRLATLHNLHYYFGFMRRVRESIESGTFGLFYREMSGRLAVAYPQRERHAEE